MSNSSQFLRAWMAQCDVTDVADVALTLGADSQLIEKCLKGEAQLPAHIVRHAEWISQIS